MKVALLADTHFGCRSDNKVFLTHQEKFFGEIFFPTLEERNIDTVLHLGDIFDRRKFINFSTLNESKRFFFDVLKNKNITMHAIIGNHDVFYTTTNEVNSPDLLLPEYDNIHLYQHEPKELKFDSTRIIMCPWLVKDTYADSMKKIKESKAHILMGHFDIKGFEMMKGIVSEHGIDHREFSQFESVYSGHYHHPSKYGNIRYLGAQYEMNWSDYGEARGFYLLDTETRELEFIENTNRAHHKIDYDDTDLTLDDVAALDTSVLKDCFVKLIVKTRTNPYLYDMFMEKLNDSGAADVKSVEDTLNLDGSGMDVEAMIEDAKDTQEMLHLYIDSVETKIEKNTVKRVVDELYQEAINL
jgi:DNA repair exonuclease SbcCD nuclease subunit